MSVPTWSGDEHTLGNFRYRVLWFRVLIVTGVSIGLTGAFGAGYTVGQRSAPLGVHRAPRAASPDRVAESLPVLEAKTQPLRALDDWDDYDPEDADGEPPLSKQAQAAVLAEAQVLAAKDRARREAELARNRPVQERLRSQNVSLNFDETPFAEAVDFLRDITGLNYVISREARDLIQNEELKVSLRLKEISLQNAIKLILASHESLEWRIREGVVLISTADDLIEDLLVEVYVVKDIVEGKAREAGGFAVDPDVLIELLESCGLSDEGSLEYQRGALIARKSAVSQGKISKLLGYLRGAEQPAAQEPAWITTYTKLLESRKVTLNFPDTPLSEVVSFLQDITGLNITIGGGVDAEETIVSIRLRDIFLKDALTLILEQTNLAQSFRHETLLIHEPDEARGDFTLKILDVRDVRAWLEPDTIEELVTNTVGEDRWDDPASISVHRGQIMVWQTAEGHASVKNVLAKLRVSRAKSAAKLEQAR